MVTRNAEVFERYIRFIGRVQTFVGLVTAAPKPGVMGNVPHSFSGSVLRDRRTFTCLYRHDAAVTTPDYRYSEHGR